MIEWLYADAYLRNKDGTVLLFDLCRTWKNAVPAQGSPLSFMKSFWMLCSAGWPSLSSMFNWVTPGSTTRSTLALSGTELLIAYFPWVGTSMLKLMFARSRMLERTCLASGSLTRGRFARSGYTRFPYLSGSLESLVAVRLKRSRSSSGSV